jgi:hypothetical protein
MNMKPFPSYTHHDASTGKFVSAKQAKAKKATTVRVKSKPSPKNCSRAVARDLRKPSSKQADKVRKRLAETSAFPVSVKLSRLNGRRY